MNDWHSPDEAAAQVREMCEEALAKGEEIESVGAMCHWCGIPIEVPWEEVDEFEQRLLAHLDACPRPQGGDA